MAVPSYWNGPGHSSNQISGVIMISSSWSVVRGPRSGVTRDYAYWLAKREASSARSQSVDVKSLRFPCWARRTASPSVVTRDRGQVSDGRAHAARAGSFRRGMRFRGISGAEIRTGIPADHRSQPPRTTSS
jgi:hypothetical protein